MATPQGFQNVVKLSKANSQFAMDMYKFLTDGKLGKNVFFSPISISTALAMTHLGARGNTSTQMSNVMRFNEMEEAQLHTTFQEFNSMLYSADRPYTIKSANRLFGQESYTFLQEFLDATAKHYSAQLKPVDFAKKTEEARLLINTWVEEQTEGKIKDLIASGSLDPLTTLVLVNAIYFKGNWASKFKTEETKIADFFITKEDKVEVSMMHQKGKFNFGFDRDSSCQILELPYIGGHLSMVLILPTAVDGLQKVETKLNADVLNTWPKMMSNTTVIVSIPKFKLEQAFIMNKELAAMGMSDLFNAGKADLSGINGNNELYVSKVIHKAFVEVNEEGTEAAAATAVVMRKRSLDMPAQFIANHPFIFVIRDNRTNAILFMGRYSHPPSNGNGRDEL
ncbi:leukocyte elastase inhibitor-like isoform X2 [Glandiceps talaboti]